MAFSATNPSLISSVPELESFLFSISPATFTTASKDGKTLKSILEDPNIPKCIRDVRNDADALWALYNVGLSGVTDIQLLENASRASDNKYVRGLDKCVQFDLKLGFMETHCRLRTKKLGPWGSDAERNGASFGAMLDALEEQRLDDDIDFYNDDFNDWDDSGCNGADGAMDEEAFESCWDKC